MLSEISGGNLRNAIPRAAHAIVGVHSSRKEDIIVAFNHYVADVENEYKATDPNMSLTIKSIDKPEYAIDSDTTTRLIRALYACPHGVISMSHDLEGLVETSTNLASVKMQPDSTSSFTVAESLLCACTVLRAWEREHDVTSVRISRALVSDKKYFSSIHFMG